MSEDAAFSSEREKCENTKGGSQLLPSKDESLLLEA